MSPTDLPSKVCQTCGRLFQWRKKWQNSWDKVQYCSSQCRNHKPGKLEKQIEETILKRLNEQKGESLCPSQVAQELFPNDERWRQEMERVRQAARRLVHQNQIEITQKGKVVDPSTFKGPIRLRRKN